MERSLVLRRIGGLTAVLACLTFVSPVSSLAGSVTLHWTAPGGDSLTGQAARYDLRYSIRMITTENFVVAKMVAGLPRPGVPGTSQSLTIEGLQPGLVHYFAIKSADAAGNWSAMSNVVARYVPVIAALDEPVALAFSAPQPNPAVGTTRFEIALPGPASVRLDVFDVSGRRVRRLMDGPRGPGTAAVTFDLRDDGGARLAPGIYLVRARLGEAVFLRRLAITR